MPNRMMQTGGELDSLVILFCATRDCECDFLRTGKCRWFHAAAAHLDADRARHRDQPQHVAPFLTDGWFDVDVTRIAGQRSTKTRDSRFVGIDGCSSTCRLSK